MHSNMNDNMRTAAFMATGLQCSVPHEQFSDLLNHWDGGHLELLTCLVLYAPLLNEMIEAGMELTGGVPGVPEYELAEPFGEWFGQQVLATAEPMGEPPSPEACAEKLRELVQEFFKKSIEPCGSPTLAGVLDSII